MKHDRTRLRSGDDVPERGWLSSHLPSWVAPSVSVALAASVAMATFPSVVAALPGQPLPLGPGLDASWIHAINVLPHTDLFFGKDVVFTYGPLGYLAVPTAVGSNLTQGAIVRLLAQLGLAVLMVRSYLQRRLVAPVATFALLFILAAALPVSFDYRLLLVLALLLGLSTGGPLWLVAASLLAAALLFVKFSAGLAAMAMLAVWSGTALWTRRARPRKILVLVTAPYLLGVVALAAILLRSFAGFGRWLEGSIEIVRGYPSAMAVPGSAGLLWLGLVSVVVFVGGVVMAARADRSTVAAGAALVVLVLIAFRHSFTRSGDDFFPTMLASSAVLVLLARERHAFRRSVVTALVLVPAVVLGVAGDPLPLGSRVRGPVDGWRSLQAAFTPDQLRREVQATSDGLLVVDRLPSDWVADIRASRGMDTVPAEIAFVPANDLPWIPNPTLQTYQAYTRSLDSRVADHFSEDGPPFLLAQFVNIDGRHPMLDAPATWRAIVSSYEMDRYADLALLRRRAAPLPMDLRVADRGTAHVGSWIDVPSTRGYLFLSARFHPTVRGRLTQLLWRLDPVLVDLRYADGRVVTWRILPTTAENGLLVAPLPSCFAELVALMEDRPVSPVLQLRFRGPGAGFYEDSTDLVWLEAPGAVRPQGAAGGVC